MADLLQDNLALGERLDKHGTRLYNLEKLDIPHKVSQAVDEIVTDAVDWAMQAPLRAHFRDLPTVDIKEILQQRMFEDDSYKANNVHKDLYEALQKSLELDYSNQRLADQEEARKKRRKIRDAPRSPPGSPPSHAPPPPPPTGASGAPGTSGASGSSQLPPPPPPPSSSTSRSTPQQGREVPRAQELSPSDDLMHDDSAPDEQVQVSDDQDSKDDHTIVATDSRKDWWKPLPEEERPTTPKLAWTEKRVYKCIKGAPYYGDCQEHVAKYQQFLDEERGKAVKEGATKSSEATKVTKPKAAKATKPAVIFPVNNNERKIMRFNEIYKFSDGTLTRILETLDYRVKEFKIKRLNLGMNTRFWTKKDVTRSKEFITAIKRRLKTRRIYQNLECFVGGRVHDIDYRLLQRIK
ncbi:hypothetical protein Tco_0257857 [Tanacetum coccineum]